MYDVRFIGNDDLPEGVDWAAVESPSGECALFVKWSACKSLGQWVALPADAIGAAERLRGRQWSSSMVPIASNA